MHAQHGRCSVFDRDRINLWRLWGQLLDKSCINGAHIVMHSCCMQFSILQWWGCRTINQQPVTHQEADPNQHAYDCTAVSQLASMQTDVWVGGLHSSGTTSCPSALLQLGSDQGESCACELWCVTWLGSHCREPRQHMCCT